MEIGRAGCCALESPISNLYFSNLQSFNLQYRPRRHRFAIIENSVRRRQLQQAHVAAAQGQGQAVAAGEGLDAGLAGQRAQRLHADALQHFHGRDVVAVGQRGPHAHGSVILAVVILRAVGGQRAVGILHREGRGQVGQDRRRGQRRLAGAAAPRRVERRGVGEGLDGAARLARR